MSESLPPVSSGAFVEGAFVLPIRVYYADTDAGGIVYHARYLDMAERTRTEMLRALNQPLVGPEGTMFVVSRAELDWRRPARLEDMIHCVTVVTELGAARVTLRQRFVRDQTVLADAVVRIAHVSAAFRPVRMPEALRRGFATVFAEADR